MIHKQISCFVHLNDRENLELLFDPKSIHNSYSRESLKTLEEMNKAGYELTQTFESITDHYKRPVRIAIFTYKGD